VKVGIRPEEIQVVASGGAGFTSHVELVEPMGLGTIIHIRAGRDTLKIFVLERINYPIGTTIKFTLPASKLHIFDAETGQRLAESASPG
jgi:multiple sugar transport system ATP-binding protein